VKRPEGVSAPTTRGAAAPPPKTAPTRKPSPSAQQGVPSGAASPRPRTGPPPEPDPQSELVPRSKPQPKRTPKAESAPRRSRPAASRDRTARAEFRAAERARARYEKQEVKRFTRQSRRRRLSWAIGVGLLVTIVALVLTAVFSPLLALRTVTIDGTSRLDTAKLQKAIDGQLGTPLALLDYGRITRELAPFSLIRSYVTEVVPPDTLVIHVVERTPVGAIQTASGFELVDPAGVVVDTSATRPEGYPLIQLGTGAISGPGFASMTEVLLALPASVLAKVDTITALTHDDVTLTLAGSSQRVVWGSSDGSDAKAQLLAKLIALHGGSGPGEYDVSAPGTAVFHQG
jgi:cell division protein FtsQ